MSNRTAQSGRATRTGRRGTPSRQAVSMAIRRIHQGIEPLEARTLLAAAGPTITAATPAELFNLKTESLTALTVSFSEAVNASSFTAEDVKIVGPDGPITPASIDTFDDQYFTIEIPAQTRRGIYRISVGPNITDPGGHPMDQNQNGTPGEPADAYTWSFQTFNADTPFTTPFTITAADEDYEDQDIAIIGTTLTIDGAHSFHSVQLMKGAVVTNTAGSAAGISLTIAEDAIVDAGSKVTADTLGYRDGKGPGATSGDSGPGAGYGGTGGRGGAAGGPTYGSCTSPSSLGSGGTSVYSGTGGWGGGSVVLKAGGTIWVDGAVSVNGGNGVGFYLATGGGGGSGGSIWLTAAKLAGKGSISSNGGQGGDVVYQDGGGGAGGRIALYYDTNTFTGTLAARGGWGYQYGGAGTIFCKSPTEPDGKLIIDNAGKVGASTPLPSGQYTLDALEVGSIVVLPAGPHTVHTLILRPTGSMTLGKEVVLDFARCQVQAGASLAIENSATDDPDDLLEVQLGGQLTLTGLWTNRGTISAAGSLALSGDWANIGTISSNGAATLQGSWTNSSKISIAGAATLQGTYTNEGSISVGGKATLQGVWTNNGTISAGGVATLIGPWNNNGAVALTGSLIVRPPQDAIPSTYTTVYSQLRSGVLGKPARIWTNVNEDPQPCTAVGSFFNGYPNNPNLTLFAGQTIQKGDVLLKYVYFGDANMDGVVNADDYHLIDKAFIVQPGGWYNGDFNYDGVINADDYFLIDRAFLCQSGPLAAGEPEPAEAASEQSAVVTRVQPQKTEADQSILAQLFSTEPVM